MIRKLYDYAMLHIGLLLVTAGILLFKVPNKFATGGVTGMAIIVNKIYPSLSVGFLMLIMNLILIIIGFFFTSLEFEKRTIYSTIMLSLLVWLGGKWYPIEKPLTGDTMLELFAAILLLAAGSALLFYQNASSGGTDIIAKVINMRAHLHIGKTVLITDLIISAFALFIFGIRIGMYSVLGVIIKGFLIDAVIRGLHGSKQVVVISTKSGEIQEYIMRKLNRGVTVYKATGANTQTEFNVLNSVMSSRESLKLKQFIKGTDKKAFVYTSNVTDIVGHGFANKDL